MEAAFLGHRPTTGHYGCTHMMMMAMMILEASRQKPSNLQHFVISHYLTNPVTQGERHPSGPKLLLLQKLLLLSLSF